MRAKILRSCCTIAMSLSSALPVLAQDDLPAIEPTEPADNVALVSNVQSHMDYFSGAAYVQIPLYTLSEFGMQVPISIGYKTSGIKVEDVASPVGLGWNLSAGGKITRMLKRNPDESTNGRLKDHASWSGVGPIYNAIEDNGAQNTDERVDKEPDLFYFEIPGYSGMFVCDLLGGVHTIPYQNIDITWTNLSYFTIKDPNGNTYVLGQTVASQEKTTYDSDVNGDGKTVVCTSSWLLDRIEDRFGNRITFTYTAGSPVSTVNGRASYSFWIDHYYWDRTGVISNPPAYDFTRTGRSVGQTVEAPKYLQSIKGKNTEIRFTVGARTDQANAKKYERMDVLAQEKTIKSIGFKYSYFTSATPRLRLDGVYERIGGASIVGVVPFAGSTSNSDFGHSLLNGSTEKIADFIYNTMPELPPPPPMEEPPYIPPYNPGLTDPPIVSNGVDSSSTDFDPSLPEGPQYEMPDRGTLDFDHWGYYRGYTSFDVRNTNAFPKFNDGFCSFSGRVGLNDQFQMAGNRSPVLDFAKSGSLARVYHKAGGYTEYRYELNQVVEDGATVDVGGLRVKEIAQVADGKEQVTSLTYGPGIRAGEKPNYSYYLSYYKSGISLTQYSVSSHNNGENFNFSGNTTEYPWVRETLPNGAYTIYDYLSGNDEGHGDIGAIRFDKLNPKMSQIYFGRTPTVTSRFWRRGLLRKTRHYDARGNLISSVTNNYSFGVRNNGDPKAVVQATSLHISGTGVVWYGYEWISEPVFLTNTITYAGPYNAFSEVMYTYDTDHLVPTKVEKADDLGNVIATNIIYPFYYDFSQGLSTSTPETRALKLMYDQKIVAPITTWTERNHKIVGSEYTIYQPIEVPGDDGLSREAVVPASKWSLTLTEGLDPDNFIPEHPDNDLAVDPSYKPQIYYDHYDLDGQLLTSHAPDGNPQSVLYDSAGRPIAKIENAVVSKNRLITTTGGGANENEVYYTSFEDNTDTSYGAAAKTGAKTWLGRYSLFLNGFKPGIYSVSYWKSHDWGETWERVDKTLSVGTFTAYSIDEGSSTCIDELRIMPRDARMTTYTYDPNGTVTSVTDTNGVTTYYQYDEFGRLIRTLDNHHQTMKSYEYHLKNQ